MFGNICMAVLNFAFPDVCMVPTPVGPIPLPFPNFAISITHIPSQFTVILQCGLAENLLTMGTISNGDDVGVSLGVASGMFIGPDRQFLGSFKVFMGGIPATRLTTLTGQNGLSPNMIGASLTPSQFCAMWMT